MGIHAKSAGKEDQPVAILRERGDGRQFPLPELGAALYWAYVMTSHSQLLWRPSFLVSAGYDSRNLAITITVVVLALAIPVFRLAKARRLLALGSTCCVALGMAMVHILSLLFPDPVVIHVFRCILSVGTGGLMALWGYLFCCFDVQRAWKAVITTSLLTIVLFLLVCAPIAPIPQYCLAKLYPMFSGVIAVFTCDDTDYARIGPANKSKLYRFCGGRVFVGLFTGLAIGFGTSMVSHTASKPLTAVIAVLLGAAFLIVLVLDRRSQRISTNYIVVCPLVTATAVSLPFLAESLSLFVQVSIAAIWSSWIIFSSASLSTAKAAIGIDEVSLSFVEKAVIKVSWTIGLLITKTGFVSEMFRSAGEEAFATFVLLFSYVLLAVVTMMLLRMQMSSGPRAGEKQREEEKPTPISADANIAAFCEEYHLTAREGDVLCFLAEGHSRKSIAQTLFVSESTVKTHIEHIYQKTGVGKKDDLLRLLRQGTESSERF